MATYLYRCPHEHELTIEATMGAAPVSVECACARPARRIFTAPMLSSTQPARRRALDTAIASAETPDVVTEIPPARRASQ